MSNERTLDRCGICSLLGEDAADELCGCKTSGLDPDSYGDQVALDGILRDKEKCERCHDRQSVASRSHLGG